MTFSTYLFLCLFLPLTLGGYFVLSKLKNPVYQRIFLLFASLVFIGYAGWRHLIWLLVSGAAAYLCARFIQTSERPFAKRLFLILGVVIQVGLLGYLKYFNFFAENLLPLFGRSFEARNLFLPLGISFFVFQQLMMLLEVYHGTYRVGNLLTYSLFLSFFPYRSSGPIVDYGVMAEQFEGGDCRRFDAEKFTSGLYLLLCGLAKKLVLADTLAIFANNGFSSEGALALPAAWVIALSYTFQLYFDFSGYSDMASGISRMMGFELVQNFDSPYRSESCTVFWRRWHMSLGRALTKCVYIPLGGNRRGTARTCLNIFLVMAVSGLWHGASWTFVLWGVIYGLIQVFERVSMRTLEKFPKGLRVAGTFLIVNALWVLFRAPDLPAALRVYRGMFNFSKLSLSSITALTADGIVGLPTFAALALVAAYLGVSFFIVFCCENAYRKSEALVLNRKLLWGLCALAVLSFVHLSRLSTFIYVNF